MLIYARLLLLLHFHEVEELLLLQRILTLILLCRIADAAQLIVRVECRARRVIAELHLLFGGCWLLRAQVAVADRFGEVEHLETIDRPSAHRRLLVQVLPVRRCGRHGVHDVLVDILLLCILRVQPRANLIYLVVKQLFY